MITDSPLATFSFAFSVRSGVAVVPLPLIMKWTVEHLNEEDIEPMAA